MADTENPYAAPVADDGSDRAQSNAAGLPAQFYVVSLTKFYLLACTTIGLYKLYWFYAQFREQRRSGMRTIPALAAIFSLFTAHGLFRRIDSEARAQGLPSYPRAADQTVAYIVLTLLVGVVRRLGVESLPLQALGLALSVLGALPLARVQGIVNRAVGDPKGNQNSSFSPLNLVSITLGVSITLVTFVVLALKLR